jgi:hypothetical protein
MRVRPFLAARTIRKAEAPCPPVRTDTPVPETGVVDRHRRTAIGNSRLALGANKGPVALETANAEELLHRFPKLGQRHAMGSLHRDLPSKKCFL